MNATAPSPAPALSTQGSTTPAEQVTTTAILHVSDEDDAIIRKIARRAYVLLCTLGPVMVDVIDIELDLIATHANGCPLRLQALLEADDFNLLHDVAGIGRHLDRTTGKLQDCFLPRFAAPQPRKESTN